MSSFRKIFIVAIALLLSIVPVFADHMNGQYSGSGTAAGTNLELRQSGRTIDGTLSGATQATLTGQSDGGDNASGTIDIVGVGQMQFELRWTQAGLTLGLRGQSGSEDYIFTKGAAAPTTTTTQPVSPPPPPPPRTPDQTSNAAAEWYVGQGGQQYGPFTQQQIQKGLTDGQVAPTDLIWKNGMANWVAINTLPEFTPPRPNGPPPLPPSTNGPPPLPSGDPPAPVGPGPIGGETVPDQSSTTPAPTEQQLKLSAMMLGSTLGILGHELGHALIGEFQMPSTGAEEDTADEFSALIMASILEDTQGMSADTQKFLAEVIGYSTMLWFHDAQKSAQQGMNLPWYDEHSASQTRFRNTLCMIYGADPARFGFIADRVQLPERERGRCEIDHAKRYRAWELIAAPYARNKGGEYPGELPVDAPGATVKVTYAPSASVLSETLRTQFQDLGVFEAIAAGLEGLLVWNRDFEIQFADCGVANAFYDPGSARIVMCWEGIEHFFWIVAEAEGIPRSTSL